MAKSHYFLFLCFVALLLLARPTYAFGAGNIASISRIEGKNWRHGDIEDVLKTVAHLKGYKWTSMMIKRVYFGNWLRDYSQAVDVGTLKGVQADAIRLLVWILSFMTFGYATGEFEVTSDRLGCYRPEEHIDNPEDYADNIDARQYDPRLRPPVRPQELAIDPDTGMKNYIANERGDWATSAGYIRFSFARSIHFGRVFTSGANGKGREEDLFEALRCLGQGLHCMEDFGAHTNYCELALRELGFHNVFSHTGSQSEINLRGKRVYPLVTGTFGGVDFLHSVLGEATDHVTQSEVDEAQKTMQDAAASNRGGGASSLTSLLSQVPGTRDLCREAEYLQLDADNQQSLNEKTGAGGNLPPAPYGGQQYAGQHQQNMGNAPSFDAPPSSSAYLDEASHGQGNFPAPPNAAAGAQAAQSQGDSSGPVNLDVAGTIKKIYPILVFRDKVVRSISEIVEKIPGLEKLIETISEKITLFIMGLLAPYVIPLINTVTKQLKTGSSTVVDASAKHQFGPWVDPHCTAPTHSLLSKDHFSNVLNEPAGKVAAAILQYVAPRVVYAWENPGVSVEQVLDDVVRVFHHPANRDSRCEAHEKMFNVVQQWVNSMPDRGSRLNQVLSAESVKEGHNHEGGTDGGHGHGPRPQQSSGGQSGGFPGIGSGIPGLGNIQDLGSKFGFGGSGGHSSSGGGLGSLLGGGSGGGSGGGLGGFLSGGKRELGDDDGLAYGGGSAAVGAAGAGQETYGRETYGRESSYEQHSYSQPSYGEHATGTDYHHQEAPEYHHYGGPQYSSQGGGYSSGSGYQQAGGYEQSSYEQQSQGQRQYNDPYGTGAGQGGYGQQSQGYGQEGGYGQQGYGNQGGGGGYGGRY